jgi:hypothetical protein
MHTSRLIRTGAILAGLLLLAGCGSDGAGPAGNSVTDSQTLDTTQVLGLAEVPAETTDPMPVDNSALVVADVNDETSDPMPVG